MSIIKNGQPLIGTNVVMMTNEQIRLELEKFNPAPRGALRKKFAGRSITFLSFNETIDLVNVQFENSVQHQFFIGARGGIRHLVISNVS